MAKNTVHDQLKAIAPEDVSTIVNSIMELNALGKCRNNNELKERIRMYFDFCRDRSFFPGVETLATSLSVHRNTLYKWSRGENCDKERTEIVNNALQLVHAFLEEAGLSGKVSVPAYIFLAKAWMGYRETAPVAEYIPPERAKNEIYDTEQLMEQLGLDPELNNDLDWRKE